MTNPSEILNIHHLVDAFDEAVRSDRRTFIRGVGIAVLTVQCLPLIAHASGRPPLLIPYAVLKTPPPNGVKITTTQAMFHRHNIALTQKELTIVNQGGTVTQKASSHLFVIALARR